MSEVLVDRAQVNAVETMMVDTANKVYQEANRAHGAVMSAVGGAWQGRAATIAADKQDNEFLTLANSLTRELTDLQENLRAAADGTLTEDDINAQNLESITPHNFDRV